MNSFCSYLVFRSNSIHSRCLNHISNLTKSFNPKSKIYLASQIPVKKPHVKPSHIPLKKKLIDKFIYFNYGKINFVKFLNIIKKNNFEKIYYLNAFESKKKLIRDYLIFSIYMIIFLHENNFNINCYW